MLHKLQWLYIYICASVSGVFIRMLKVFHLDVCICLQWLHPCFQVISSLVNFSDVGCKCFSCFEYMLQMFHLNVTKIDQVLHIIQWDPSIAAACCSCRATVKRAQRVAACGPAAWATFGRQGKWVQARASEGPDDSDPRNHVTKLLGILNPLWILCVFCLKGNPKSDYLVCCPIQIHVTSSHRDV
jgi:hypothetical protein